MPIPRAASRARRIPIPSRVDTTTGVLGVLTLLAFAVACGARMMSDLALSAGGAPARSVASGGPTGVDPFATSDVLAFVSIIAVGSGILLLAGAVVSLSVRNRGSRLPVTLAVVVAGLAVAAVAAGVDSASTADWTAAVDAATLRTAFAGVAAACLPGVVIGAVRTRRRR